MAYVRNSMVWAEMARRKVQFHASEEWDQIKLWGLFSLGSVSRLLKDGRLLAPGYRRENRTIWCYPSKDTWDKHISPLIEQHSLDELTRMAGWETE